MVLYVLLLTWRHAGEYELNTLLARQRSKKIPKEFYQGIPKQKTRAHPRKRIPEKARVEYPVRYPDTQRDPKRTNRDMAMSLW